MWTKRTNLESENSQTVHTTSAKGQGLEEIEFAGQPFIYFIVGNYDEIEKDRKHYRLKADSVRSRNPRIINYTSILTVNSEGMIVSGEATLVRDEDSIITTREITYTVESQSVNVQKPSWIDNANIMEVD